MQHKGQSVKKRLDSCAEKLILEEGLESLTIRKVCQMADVSIGTFYNYYSSKDELIMERFKYMDAYLKEEVIPYLNGTNSDQLRQFLHGYLQNATNRGIEYLAEIQKALICHNEDKVRSKKRALHTTIRRIVSDGIASGEFNDNFSVSDLSHYWIMFIRGLLFDWQHNKGDYDIWASFEILFLAALQGTLADKRDND